METQKSAEGTIDWPLTKSKIKEIVVRDTESIVDRWKQAKPGEVLSERMLLENVLLRISRSKYEDSLMLNLFVNGNERDSAQVELRRTDEAVWDLTDRQISDELKGRGILAAFVGAAEKFVETFAEQDAKEHRIILGTAQPNVFQVFEHLGFRVREEDNDNARLLRNPERFPEEVAVQNAWMKAKTYEDRIELSNRDPYCFKRQSLVDNPHPLTKDAVRATLEKTFKPKTATLDQLSKTTRVNGQNLLMPPPVQP